MKLKFDSTNDTLSSYPGSRSSLALSPAQSDTLMQYFSLSIILPLVLSLSWFRRSRMGDLYLCSSFEVNGDLWRS